jgi:hypothetical protein
MLLQSKGDKSRNILQRCQATVIYLGKLEFGSSYFEQKERPMGSLLLVLSVFCYYITLKIDSTLEHVIV